jgi:hypothetical protein
MFRDDRWAELAHIVPTIRVFKIHMQLSGISLHLRTCKYNTLRASFEGRHILGKPYNWVRDRYLILVYRHRLTSTACILNALHVCQLPLWHGEIHANFQHQGK